MRVDLVVTRHEGLVDYLVEIGVIRARHHIYATPDPDKGYWEEGDESWVYYVNKEGRSVHVVSHASPTMVRDKHVIGVLPHSLSCLTKTFTEIPLDLPAELRGKKLSLEEVRKYAGEPVTYKVEKV